MMKRYCYSLIILITSLFVLTSCEKDNYDYLDDDDFTFWLDDKHCYQAVDGTIYKGTRLSCDVKYPDECTRRYCISIRLYRDIDNYKNGQNITDEMYITEIRSINTIYLGDVSYDIKSGNVYLNKTTGNKYELIFNDVEVYARMVNICDEETHRTYRLKGKLVFEK